MPSLNAICCKITCGWLKYLLLLAALPAAARNLEISVIYVEGGKAVLFVSPSGQSLLFDAGWPVSGSRPASTDRIVDAARAAGLKRIDLLVISHFDIDHIGDLAQLASKIPIGHVFDHGDMQTTNAQARQRFAADAAARDWSGHTTLKPSDRLPADLLRQISHARSGGPRSPLQPRSGLPFKSDRACRFA